MIDQAEHVAFCVKYACLEAVTNSLRRVLCLLRPLTKPEMRAFTVKGLSNEAQNGVRVADKSLIVLFVDDLHVEAAFVVDDAHVLLGMLSVLVIARPNGKLSL